MSTGVLAPMATWRSDGVTRGRGVLQRKCACGGAHAGEEECVDCRNKHLLQRKPASWTEPSGVPAIVHEVLRSPGQPLDAATSAFMQPRFGHDFCQVRVHTDAKAAESARAVNALAYTVGRDIAFAGGQFSPSTAWGRRLLAHELTHVVQQGAVRATPSPAPPRVLPGVDGGVEIVLPGALETEPEELERQADRASSLVTDFTDATPQEGTRLRTGLTSPPRVQRLRVPMPRPVPLCGLTVTHIDVEPPRWRPLAPCLPPTVLVNRVNIVGRQVTPATTGRGRMVFNLHIGYYTDPATGRFCGVMDDSMRCVAPRCVMLGCFPTLREVWDAIKKVLETILEISGIIALIIIIVLLGRWLIRPGPIVEPVPVMAEAEQEAEGTGEAVG